MIMKTFNTETLTPVSLADISVGDVITVFATYPLHPSAWIPDVIVYAVGGYGITGEEENHFGVGTCTYYKKIPTLPTTQGEYIIIDELHLTGDIEQIEAGTVAMFNDTRDEWFFLDKRFGHRCKVRPQQISRWRPLDTK